MSDTPNIERVRFVTLPLMHYKDYRETVEHKWESSLGYPPRPMFTEMSLQVSQIITIESNHSYNERMKIHGDFPWPLPNIRSHDVKSVILYSERDMLFVSCLTPDLVMNEINRQNSK